MNSGNDLVLLRKAWPLLTNVIVMLDQIGRHHRHQWSPPLHSYESNCYEYEPKDCVLSTGIRSYIKARCSNTLSILPTLGKKSSFRRKGHVQILSLKSTWLRSDKRPVFWRFSLMALCSEFFRRQMNSLMTCFGYEEYDPAVKSSKCSVHFFRKEWDSHCMFLLTSRLQICCRSTIHVMHFGFPQNLR